MDKNWSRKLEIQSKVASKPELCMERYIEYSPAPKEGYCKLPKGHKGEHKFERVYDFLY